MSKRKVCPPLLCVVSHIVMLTSGMRAMCRGIKAVVNKLKWSAATAGMLAASP